MAPALSNMPARSGKKTIWIGIGPLPGMVARVAFQTKFSAVALAKETRREWKGKPTLFDPGVNIALGAYYLDKLIKRFGDFLKNRCQGCEAYLYLGKRELVK